MNPFDVLKVAKKRKGLTVRDFHYGVLEDLVHKGLLDKSFPKRGRGPGWPAYKISRKGLKYLEKTRKYIAQLDF